MFNLTLRKRALSVLLLFAVLLSLFTTPFPSFAESNSYQEYVAYKESLGSSASFGVDPLAIKLTPDETIPVYCYNYELNYPLEEDMGGTPGYMHDHYPNLSAPIQEQINRILHNGYPNNASGYQADLTDLEFRGVTQYAIWHFTDNLSRDKIALVIKGSLYPAPPNVDEIVEKAMEVFDKLVSDTAPEPSEDFKVDYFMPQDPGYQNLLGAIQTTIPDPGPSTQVTIRKVDSESDELLEGALLKVTDDQAMNFEFTSSNMNKLMYLENGKEYTLSEVTPPDGYSLAEDIRFRVTDEGVVEVYAEEEWIAPADGMVTMKDALVQVITLEVAFSKTAQNSTEELPGAALKVVRGEEIDGEQVEAWTSAAEQKKLMLEADTYCMVETAAPDGYEVANPIIFRITSDGNLEIKEGDNWVSLGTPIVHMEDIPVQIPSFEVIFSKTAQNSTEELPGATLKVVRGEVVDGEQVEAWTSTAEQKNLLLEAGTYCMVETAAPDGYEMAQSIVFRVSDQGIVELKEGDNWTPQATAMVHMQNRLMQITSLDVFFSKTAVGSLDELLDAKLKVVKGETEAGALVEEWTSIAEQKMIKLDAGTYTMVELQAPVGYALADNIIFRITDEGRVEIKDGNIWTAQNEPKIHMEDAPLGDVKVVFSKTSLTGSEELEGAKLTVNSNNSNAVNESWASAKVAKEITLPRNQEYTMIETAAPKGYEIAENIIFRITNEGAVEIKNGDQWVAQDEAKVHMKDAATPAPTTTVVAFSKVEVNGTKELPGAELKITRNADKKLISSWVSSSVAKSLTLERGVAYTMTEVQAPKGYEIADSIVFRITKEGKVEIKDGEKWVAQKEAKVTMEDAPSEKPKPENQTLKVKFSKIEAKGKKELPGAQLKITRNSDKKLISSWTSASVEKIYTLERGEEYTLFEVQAPKDYAKADDIIFRITHDGKVEIKKGKEWVAQKEAKVVMVNTLLKELPSTGQKGGYFLALGVILLLLALLFLRKARQSNK